MKKAASVFASALVLVSVVGLAQTPSQAPPANEFLAAIFATPAANSACPMPQGEVALRSDRRVATKLPTAGQTKAECRANCYPGGPIGIPVTCSGSTCNAVNRDCTIGERGHVTCDGTTYYCTNTCNLCQKCYDTGDCVACCWCGGGTIRGCGEACNGG